MLLTPPPVALMARGVLGASVVPATCCESWAPVTPRAPRAPVSSAVLCTGPPPWPWAASVSLVSVRRRRALQRTVGVTAALVSLPRPLPCLPPLSLPSAVRGCAWRNTAATRSNGDGGAGATGDADDPSPRRPTVAVLLRGTGELRPTCATAAAPLGASVAAVFAGGWSEVPSCTRALEAAVIASRLATQHANDEMSMFCMKRIAISALRTQQWRGLRVPAMASAQGAPPLAAAAAVPAVLIVLVVDTSVGMTVTTSHVGMTGLDHAKHAVRAAVASTMWQPCGIPNRVVV